MILEELVARLGFKVEGLEKVRAATTAMNPLQRQLKSTASSTAIAAAGVSRLKTAMSGLANIFRVIGAAARSFLSGLARIAGILGGVAVGIGGLVAVAVKLAKAFADVGGKIAQARKEAALMAKAQRTTVEGQNAFQGAVGSFGLTDEKSKELADKFYEDLFKTANDAILGDGEAKDKLKKLGVKSAMDAQGNQLDTTDIARLAIGNLLSEIGPQVRARREAAAMPAGKERTAAFKKVNADEIATRRKLNTVGIDDQMIAFIRRLAEASTTAGAFERAMQKAAADNPGQTEAQKARSDELAAAYSELTNKMKGLSEPFNELAIIMAESVIKPLNSFASALLTLGKTLGLINETVGEKAAKQQNAVETTRGKARMSQTEAAANLTDAEQAIYHLAQSISQQQSILDQTKRRVGANPTPQGQRSITQAEGDISNSKADLKKLIDNLGTLSQSLEWARQLVDPKTNADKISKDKAASAAATYDNRKYEDIGADKRVITNSVTVNATGLEAVGQVIKNALSGSNLVKSTTASTAAMAQP